MYVFHHLIIGLSFYLCCIQPSVFAHISEFNSASLGLTTDASESDSVVLEPINGTRDYRINSKKDHYDRPWFDSRDVRFINCIRPAKCEKLRNNTCFGSKLPYSSTSLALTDSFSQEESQEKLYNYEALRNIPKCWAVIQPFLCAVFSPRCERIKNRDMVYLPSLEMCRITMEPCRMLYNTTFFPKFLKCNETFFPSKCNNDVREVKFNTIGQCMAPLVAAESAASYYKNIEGCGLQCKDPLYVDDEHKSTQCLMLWGIGICLTLNILTIATYSIHEYKKSKYPAKIVCLINMCFLVSLVGWALQFFPGHRDNIVCHKDGTLRHSEPKAGENLACLIQFVLIYYFLMAATVWFALLTYAWYLQTSDQTGKIREEFKKKKSYFHLAAWSLPLVLTIGVLAFSEVDADSTIGICFVGLEKNFWFVQVPVVAFMIVSTIFCLLGVLRLNQLKKNDYSATHRFKSIILHFIARFILTIMLLAAWAYLNDSGSAHIYADSLTEMILCKIRSAYSDSHTVCKLEFRPSISTLQLRLCCLFGVCIANSSWCLTWSTFNSWCRFWNRKFGRDDSEDEEVTKPKHKMIAEAYARRNESVLSLELEGTHSDPVGVNFNVSNLVLNESNEMTSSFRNNIPNFLKRRNAMTNLELQKRDPFSSSFDQSIQYMQTVSIECESRRSSIDSTISFKVSGTEIHLSKPTRIKKGRNIITHTRRASSSSVEGQIVTKNAKYHQTNNNIYIQSNGTTAKNMKRPKMGRRGACAGINLKAIKSLVRRSRNQTSCSEDDAVSHTSFKIQNAKKNIVLRGISHNDSINSSEIQSEQHIHMENRIESTGYRTNMHKAISKRRNRDNDINSSSLSDEIDVLMNGTHSSYSGVSIENKTHSRNSKASCDVGIQANPFDITSDTMALEELVGQFKIHPNAFHDDDDDEDECIESHLLVKKRQTTIVSRANAQTGISENERLRNLLMPA